MVHYRKEYQLLSYINTLKLKVIYDSLIGLKDIDNLLRDVGLFLKLDVNSHPQLYKCLEVSQTEKFCIEQVALYEMYTLYIMILKHQFLYHLMK